MHTLTSSKDPDEMPHNRAFHLGLHFLLRCELKKMRVRKMTTVPTNTGYFKQITVNNLWCRIYNGVQTNTRFIIPDILITGA